MSSKDKLARLKEAEDDAKRFLARAKALREALKENIYIWNNPVGSGALGRAFLDLTRSLAAWRKP